MTKKQIEERLEAAEKQMIGLQNEIQNLKAKLDEVQDGEIPDYPVFNFEDAYRMDDDLNAKLAFETFFMNATPAVKAEGYNFFHTKEMAQLFADKCKLIAMMLHCKQYLEPDLVPDWSDEKPKYFVYGENSANEYDTDCTYFLKQPTIYFSSSENARKCANWLNSRRDKDES